MKINIKHYEHARELIDKYLCVEDEYEGDNGCGITPYEAKQCALIAVDEIMKANPIIPLEFMLESESLDAANEYWNEVKQEIKKL